MRLSTRVNALEKRASADKDVFHIVCVHSDDWQGELGLGCIRQFEIDEYSEKMGPGDYGLFICDLLICRGTDQRTDTDGG